MPAASATGSSSGAVRAGGAFVELFTKDSALMKGLNRARAHVSAFGSSMRKAGAFVIGAGAGLLAPVIGLMRGAFDKAQQGLFGAKAAQEAFRAALAWERMVNALQKATLPIASLLLPTFEKIAKFAEENAEVVQIIAAIGASLVVLGVVMVPLGSAISAAAGTVSALMSVLSFLLTPVGLVILGVVALTAAWLALVEYMSGGVSRAFGAVASAASNAFGGIGDDFKTMFTGIVDALKSGDLSLAGQIAFVGLRVAWARGMLFLTDVWVRFKASFVDGWHDLLSNIGHLIDEMVYQVADGLLDVLGLVKDVSKEKKDLFRERITDQRERDKNFEQGQKERDEFRKKQLENAEKIVADARNDLGELAKNAVNNAKLVSGGDVIPMPIKEIKGAFQSPNWQSFLSTADTIPKQQLAAAAKQVVLLENINDNLKDAQPMKIK